MIALSVWIDDVYTVDTTSFVLLQQDHGYVLLKQNNEII